MSLPNEMTCQRCKENSKLILQHGQAGFYICSECNHPQFKIEGKQPSNVERHPDVIVITKGLRIAAQEMERERKKKGSKK